MNIETTIEVPAHVFYLSRTPDQAGEIQDAVTLGQGLPDKDELGNAIKYKWVPCAKIGAKYLATVKNPKTGALGKAVLNCSEPNVNQWMKAFDQKQKNGVKTPITKGHFNRTSDDGRGYIVGLKKNNGWLHANMKLIGEDAIRAAARNEVSIGVKSDYTDGIGREYGDAIEHMALTMFPVAPGQSQADQSNGLLAASRADSEDEPIVFNLSGADETTVPAEPEKETPMSDKTALSKAHRAKMCEMMSREGDADKMKDMDDESLMSRFADHHTKLLSDAQKLHANATVIRNMSMEDVLADGGKEEFPTLHDEIGNLRDVATKAATERDALAGQVKNLSQDDAPVNTEVLYERSLRINQDFDRLKTVNMAPAAVDKLKKAFVGTPENLNVICLSREDGATDCPAGIIAATLLESGGLKAAFSPDPKAGENGVRNLSMEDHPATKAPVADEDFKPMAPERKAQLLGAIGIDVPKKTA